MIRALLLCFLLGACPALAQHVTGPLQAQNNLSEIAKNGATAQAQARANIGAGSATVLWPTVGAVVVSNGTRCPGRDQSERNKLSGQFRDFLDNRPLRGLDRSGDRFDPDYRRDNQLPPVQ